MCYVWHTYYLWMTYSLYRFNTTNHTTVTEIKKKKNHMIRTTYIHTFIFRVSFNLNKRCFIFIKSVPCEYSVGCIQVISMRRFKEPCSYCYLDSVRNVSYAFSRRKLYLHMQWTFFVTDFYDRFLFLKWWQHFELTERISLEMWHNLS